MLPLVLVLLLVSQCGYKNPNIYNGPHKTIYVAQWKNRTSELELDQKIYRSLTEWFEKSGSISTVRQKGGSDLILAGEVISIELPSLSYYNSSNASEVKVRLRVRYILKEIATNRILVEVPDETWTEEYFVSSSSSTNMDNEEDALDIIVEDLSKKIYQRTVSLLPTL